MSSVATGRVPGGADREALLAAIDQALALAVGGLEGESGPELGEPLYGGVGGSRDPAASCDRHRPGARHRPRRPCEQRDGRAARRATRGRPGPRARPVARQPRVADQLDDDTLARFVDEARRPSHRSSTSSWVWSCSSSSSPRWPPTSGAARQAALIQALLDTRRRCLWPGCWQSRIQIDHADEHCRGGPTDLANASPLCGYHNRFKSGGYRTRRGADGRWHIYRPDGTEIGSDPGCPDAGDDVAVA